MGRRMAPELAPRPRLCLRLTAGAWGGGWALSFALRLPSWGATAASSRPAQGAHRGQGLCALSCLMQGCVGVLLWFFAGYYGCGVIYECHCAGAATTLSSLRYKGDSTHASYGMERSEGVVLGTVIEQLANVFLAWCGL